MDVDDDDEGTQRVKRVPDYGIEVDFEALGEIDADVSLMLAIILCHSLNIPLSRKIPRRPSKSLTRPLPRRTVRLSD